MFSITYILRLTINVLDSIFHPVTTDIIGKPYKGTGKIDNQELIAVNKALRNHPVEKVGATLRASMTAMKQL